MANSIDGTSPTRARPLYCLRECVEGLCDGTLCLEVAETQRLAMPKITEMSDEDEQLLLLFHHLFLSRGEPLGPEVL